MFFAISSLILFILSFLLPSNRFFSFFFLKKSEQHLCYESLLFLSLFFEVCFHLFLSFQAFLTSSPFLFLFPTEFIQYLKGFGASYYYHIIINMTIIIDLAELRPLCALSSLCSIFSLAHRVVVFFFFLENGWFVISSLSCLLSLFHFPPLFFFFPILFLTFSYPLPTFLPYRW